MKLSGMVSLSVSLHLPMLRQVAEAITMVQSLISQSPDIQKILAFEGAFEKLFNTITQEGGVEGGVVAQDALNCLDGLLRFNSSNQVLHNECRVTRGLDSCSCRAILGKRRSLLSSVSCCSSRRNCRFTNQRLRNLHSNSGMNKNKRTLHW